MHHEPSDRVRRIGRRLTTFMNDVVHPNEQVYFDQLDAAANRWVSPPVMAEMQQEARAAGLWNLFLPDSALGAGLTNLEYAPLCEIMGRSAIAPRSSTARRPTPATWRCWSATAARRRRHAGSPPLLAAEIRSAYAMTEPDVASSGRHQHPVPHRARRRPLRDQRPQVVDLRGGRHALLTAHPDGQDRSGRRAPPAAVDDPGAEGRAGGHAGPAADGLRLRPRPARALGDHVRQRAGAGREPPARRGPRLRDRAGPARPGAHSPLHAVHRRGGALDRSDGARGRRRGSLSASRWPSRAW